MAAKSSSTKSKNATLKQGTLPFASSKRTTSSNSITKAKQASQAKRSQTPRSRRGSTSISEDSKPDDVELISEEEEDVQLEERKQEDVLVQPTLRPRISSEKKQANKPATSVLQPKDNQRNPQAGTVERPELSDKDPRWNKHYGVVRRKMGHLKPIHGEGQNKVHEILRVFDLSYEYGPCIGVTRLERWERAAALGLNPPLEIRDILSTQQGTDQTEFSQCVFHDEV